jgi:ATP-dependent helicase/nuclease subunit A
VVLPVYEQHRYHRTLRFAPQQWATSFRDTEAKYQRAEEQRLLYVAATRAEDQLVVSQYRSPSWSADKGYWAPLYSVLEDAPTLTPPDDAPSYHPDDATDPGASGATAARYEQVAQPTYQTASVTETAPETPPAGPADGYGTALGTAVHRLFEYAIQRRGGEADRETLHALVPPLLADHDAEEHADTAHRMLDHLLDSALWTSLREAEVVHTEVPIAEFAGTSPPTLTDGTIDLLYRQAGAWHLIDFKTDRGAEDESTLPASYRAQLSAYVRLWEKATGEPVAEAALWRADTGTPVVLNDPDRPSP